MLNKWENSRKNWEFKKQKCKFSIQWRNSLRSFSKTLECCYCLFISSLLVPHPYQQARDGWCNFRVDVTTFDGFVAAAIAALLDVIRSHRGHMVIVDVERGGCRSWHETMADGATLIALSASSSRCNRWFCSVNDPNHLFKYSHSISVCFNLLLRYYC